MATHQLPQLDPTFKTPGSEEASIDSKREVVELERKTDEQIRASFTYEQEQRLLRKVIPSPKVSRRPLPFTYAR